MSFSQDLTRARNNYVTYLQRLGTPCSINRPDKEIPKAISTGKTHLVKNSVCAVSLLGGAGNSTFINTLLRSVTAKTPGARILSFVWNEDVETGDVIITDDGKYKLGLVNSDDPNRVGIQADAEIVRVP